jgi:hypothetical protein
MGSASLETPAKRISKFSLAYVLYVGIVWLFDYVYTPWLAIKFRYLMIFPLYVSIFLVSWLGYYLYEYFREDVFFINKINKWLEREDSHGIRGRLHNLIRRNPKSVFAAIATWWSPLHAYIFFRREGPCTLRSLLKNLAKGSLICALFWGVVIESCIFLWGLARGFLG